MRFAAPLLCVALTAAAPAADPVLAQLAALSATAPPTTVERTVRARNGKDDISTLVDRLQPGQPPRLLSIDGRTPTAQEAEAHARRRDNPLLFHRLHPLFMQPPRHRSEAGGRTVYQWHGLPKGMIVTPGGDISHRLTAELFVDHRSAQPQIRQLRIYAAAPFSVRIVAEIQQFNMIADYATSADGLPTLSTQKVETTVSAPMGLGGHRQSTATFRPLPPP